MHTAFVEKGIDLSNVYMARFLPGTDLFARIPEIMAEENLDRIVIISAIGSLKDIVMRDLKPGIDLPINLDKTNEIKYPGPFELLSLEGNVVPMAGKPVVHLHVMLGDPEGAVLGGHLFAATVCSTLEFFFAEVRGTGVDKLRSEITGLNEFKVG